MMMRIFERKTTQPEVVLDYPKEGEVISSPFYTFRIGTIPEAYKVEVSVNNEEWALCRESLGIWWFDWTMYQPGNYMLQARIHKEDGEIVTSPERRFSVVFTNGQKNGTNVTQ